MNVRSLVLAAVAALATLAGPSAVAQDASAERERIRSLRAAAEARYAADERACHARFAVNACLDQARTRRNDILSDLRRQELTLNEDARRRKAEERLRDLDERASPERTQAAERRRQQAVAERRAREAAAAKEAAQRAADLARRAARSGGQREAPPAAPAADGAPEKREPTTRHKQERPDEGDAKKNKAEHEARVKEAQERKARLLQRNAERPKPAASALPLPPS